MKAIPDPRSPGTEESISGFMMIELERRRLAYTLGIQGIELLTLLGPIAMEAERMNPKREFTAIRVAWPQVARPGMKTLLGLLGALGFVLGLHGCGSVVDATIRTVNADFDRQEAKRTNSIYDESLARYQAMADRGEAKGLYYMAVIHAMKQRKKADGEEDVVGIVDRYEKAISAGSNDARAALGEMLINGHSTPFGDTLWRPPHDPVRGLELLKTAATNSCSYTQPFISIGRCRERESSIARIVKIFYRDGRHGVLKNPEQETYWESRQTACEPEIEEINRRTGCDKPF